MDVVIRPLEAIDEYRACEDLQYRVWAMDDYLEVVPLHLLVTAQKNGGLLLGAFKGDELVGFVFGFPGFEDDGRLKLCSHMMGVDPCFQSAGVGYQLKLAQREQARIRGLDLVTWTYDPLEGRNAYLNIRKLGAICRAYIRNLYGLMRDGLNAGLPSDRFQVEWWIDSRRVRDRLAGTGSRIPEFGIQAHITGRSAEGLLKPGEPMLCFDLEFLKVEIPVDYQAIKSADPGLAMEWRMVTREIFDASFSAGYVVVDFVSHQTEEGLRSFYVLCSRDWEEICA